MFNKKLEEEKRKGERTERHHIYPISYGGEDHSSNIAEVLKQDHQDVIHPTINDDMNTYKKYRRKQSKLENGNAIITDEAIDHMAAAQERLLSRVSNLPSHLQDLYRFKTGEVMLHEVNKFNMLTGESYIPEVGDILENHTIYTRAKKAIAQYIRETFTK